MLFRRLRYVIINSKDGKSLKWEKLYIFVEWLENDDSNMKVIFSKIVKYG